MLRDTDYAKELIRATVNFSEGSEGRVERLFIKDRQREEVRFSWWKEGQIIMRPLDATEDQWLELFESALKEGVFSKDFRAKLRYML